MTGFAVGSVGPADESAQTLSYAIESNSNSGLFTVQPSISPAGDLTFTAGPDLNGIATIVVHALDSGPNGGGDVNFTGFGKFSVADRAPRQGVNPRTRERMRAAS